MPNPPPPLTPNIITGARTGRLATDRYDFQKHIDGYDFRHTADQTDILDPSLVYGNPSTVEEALEDIYTFINSLSSAGQGFVTVGDGYDTWHAANGTINFDGYIPALDLLLNPIFAAIAQVQSAGTDLGVPVAYRRIARGGIIVIKDGTYIVKNTINVPPGIIILGEGYGTKIINATSLDTSVLPPIPKLTPTPAPVFNIMTDGYRSINDAFVDADLFMFGRATKLMNFVICDNFVENTVASDVYYKVPQNTTGDNPLIRQQMGSNLELDNMYLMGRVLFSAGKIVSDATRFAIQLDPALATGTGTILKLHNCFVDGFSQPIQFSSIGGVNDYLEINDCKMRSHGYLNANGVLATNNCIINMNDNNANISSNDFFGNHDALTTVIFISSLIAAPPLQSRSKITVNSNTFVIDRGGAGAITPTVVSLGAGASGIASNSTISVYGNSFQDSYGFVIQDYSGTLFQVTTDKVNIPISMKHKTFTVSTSTYTIDGTSPDYMIFANTAVTAMTITLPVHDVGRKVIIKDIGFNASVNNITLARNGGTGSIDDYAGNRIIATNGASWTLMSNGTNWYII